MSFVVSRRLEMPDPWRIERFRRAPEMGPRILFFSGGTAIKGVARTLTSYTHNSIHLITPFDSGGSSAAIRRAFHMLSAGDLRNRIMALADLSITGNPDVYDLFAYRFPLDADNAKLRHQLWNMAAGRHALVARIPNPMRRIVRNHLHYFLERMPDDFDLRGASIGNLVLTGGYLNNRHHIEPVLFMFSKLINARGVVRPTTGKNYHLAARLRDGTLVMGQHRITDKSHPIPSPIEEIFLTASLDSTTPLTLAVSSKIRELIASAELVCYPMGSFYTSILANLLLDGVGSSIARNECPKVFLPNPVPDSEMQGMGLFDMVMRIVDTARRRSGIDVEPSRIVRYVVADLRRGSYPRPLHLKRLQAAGIDVIDTDLITDASAPLYDDQKVVEALLSLC